MANRELNFEFLCRVCAAQTKGKNSVAECVYILKTPELKEKIQRFLNLTITAEDHFPKVLCKTCFRQVEATASLAKIAQHTQKVFRNFLFSAHMKVTGTNCDYSDATEEFTPLELTCKEMERPQVVLNNPPTPTPTPMQPPQPPPLVQHREEVIVNVSVNDPLTRETQEKMISASQKRQSLQDSRHVPKSIAQRSMSTPKSSTDLHSASIKKSSPAGVINFFHGHPQQVTTYTSGGYIIGNTTTDSSSSSEAKRKNLQKALNKIKATNAGQVSLLKVSQKTTPQSVSQEQPQKKSKSKQTAPVADEEGPADELPEQIIIAGTKNKRSTQQQSVSMQKNNADSANSQPPPRSELADEILLGRVIKDPDLLKLILKALKWPITNQTIDAQMTRLKNSKFADIMSDQNLLQDTDLTQLLSPYVAPMLMAAQAIQQQHMAAAAAVSNQTQSYMPPFKPIDLQAAAIASAIPYKLPAETSVQLVPASPEREEPPQKSTNNSKSVPSVQFMRLDSPNQKDIPSKRSRKPTKRPYDAVTMPMDKDDVPPLENINVLRTKGKSLLKNSKHNIEMRSVHRSHGVNTSAVDTTEALRELLQRQKVALHRAERRKHSSSSIITLPASSDIELDDIILMEQQSPNVYESSSTNESSSSLGANGAFASEETPQNLQMPAPLAPLITRPIIKRRKTVIQVSPSSSTLTLTQNSATSSSTEVSVINKALPPMPPLQRRPSLPLIQPSSSSSGNIEESAIPKVSRMTAGEKSTSTTDVVTSTPNSNATQPEAAEPLPAKSTNPPKKLHNSKSALGQQLLEAIGLQKIGDNISGDGQTIVDAGTPRDPVLAVRSALKRSLKQAQQRKHVETIKQDADSTTKSIIKELPIEEAKSKNPPITDTVRKPIKVTFAQINSNEQTIKDKEDGGNKINENRRKILNTKKANVAPHGTDAESGNANKQIQARHNERASTTVNLENFIDAKIVVTTPKKRGRKRNEDKEAERREKEKLDEAEAVKVKNEAETLSSSSSGRPTRHSKTLSKYYKGPGKPPVARRSVSTRSSRGRT